MNYSLNIRLSAETPARLLDEVTEIFNDLSAHAVGFEVEKISFKADWIYSYLKLHVKDDYNLLGAKSTLSSVNEVLGDRMYQLTLDEVR